MTGETLTIRREGAVMRVVIGNLPMNILDANLRHELDELSLRLESDPSTRVVIVESALPEFFITHAGVRAVMGRTVHPQARRSTLRPFQAMVERWRTLPQSTIGIVRGAARGGDLEFLLSLDMVYASRERAIFGLPEVALGIIPAGGGTQRVARTASRGRALEVVLGCDDFTSDEAETYGLVTRSLPDSDLAPFVERIAGRIAKWPADAVRLAKQAVDSAQPNPTDGLIEEHHFFSLLLQMRALTRAWPRFSPPAARHRLGKSILAPAYPRCSQSRRPTEFSLNSKTRRSSGRCRS